MVREYTTSFHDDVSVKTKVRTALLMAYLATWDPVTCVPALVAHTLSTEQILSHSYNSVNNTNTTN